MSAMCTTWSPPSTTLAEAQRPRPQLELATLGRHLHVVRAPAQILPASGGLPRERVEEVVAVERVVVEEQKPLGASPPPEHKRVRERGVTPAEVLGVLVVGVLGIMDQQSRVASEGEA